MRRLLRTAIAALSTYTTAAIVLAAPPDTKPALPAPIVGSPEPKTFIVKGVCRFSETSGVAFYVASEAKRHVCAIYDTSDGTPLMLSDGRQTLVYDVRNARVVLVPDSCAQVRIEWEAGADKPLKFSFGVDAYSDPERLKAAVSWFRVDRFVETSALLADVDKNGGDGKIFSATRKGGSVEAVHVAESRPNWFRFTSKAADETFYCLEAEASAIGAALPAAALAFPDVQRLAAEVALAELNPDALKRFIGFMSSGASWSVKLALSGTAEDRKAIEVMLPSIDWAQVEKWDQKLAPAYRAALAKHGVRFPVFGASPTTQPVR